MKKRILAILLTVAVLVSLTGCYKNYLPSSDIGSSSSRIPSEPQKSSEPVSSEPEPQKSSKPVPSSTPVPSDEPEDPEDEPEKEPFKDMIFYEDSLNQTLELDLDGDGVMEELSIVALEDEYGDYDLTFIEENTQTAFNTGIRKDGVVIITDLDPLDRYLDIFATGDLMSSDYSTCCLRYTAEDFHSVKFFDSTFGCYRDYFFGELINLEEGKASFSCYIDVLGTFKATCTYEYSPVTATFKMGDGGLFKMDYSSWSKKEMWQYQSIRTKKELPVFIENEAGLLIESTLDPGTSILLTETNKKDTVWFTTADGTRGIIKNYKLGKMDGFTSTIDGKDPESFFKELRYSG